MKLAIIATLCACLACAACGHRGHLYLPGKPGDPRLGGPKPGAQDADPARRPGGTADDPQNIRNQVR